MLNNSGVNPSFKIFDGKKPFYNHRNLMQFPKHIEKQCKAMQIEQPFKPSDSIDTCKMCCSTFSSSSLPRMLPCQHIVCESCIAQNIVGCSFMCGSCKVNHEYQMEENGFLVSKNFSIKVFDEEDYLINVNIPNITISNIISENCINSMNLIRNLLNSISIENIRLNPIESINKHILMREFPVKSASLKTLSQLDKEKTTSLENSLYTFHISLQNQSIEIDKYDRSNDDIILESKSKLFSINMGKNLDCILNILTLLDNNMCSKQSESTSMASPKKDNASPNDSIAYISDAIAHMRILPSVCENQVKSCMDDLPYKEVTVISVGQIFDPEVFFYDQFDGFNVLHEQPIYKSNDHLFLKGDIIEGSYFRKFEMDNYAYVNFPKLKWKFCYECVKIKKESVLNNLPDKEKMKHYAKYFCQKYKLPLCIRHAFEYKIKYNHLKFISVTSREDLKKDLMRNKDEIKTLLEMLMKAQYAKRLDYEEHFKQKSI